VFFGFRPHGGTAKKLAVAFHFGRLGDDERYDCDRCQRLGFNLERNCRKTPDQEWNPRYKWFPTYQAGEGTKDQFSYSVPSAECSECPVTFVTSESRQLIDWEARNKHLKDATGATMYGPNVNRWPQWFADLIAAVEIQRKLEHNAFQAAQQRKFSR